MVDPSVRAEWRRAQDSMGAAEACRDSGFHADAISRAYYAILHAAKAALALQGFASVRGHGAVQRLFGSELVLKDLVEREWSARLRQSHARRNLADYHVLETFTVTHSREAVEQASAFLSRMQSLVGDTTT